MVSGHPSEDRPGAMPVVSPGDYDPPPPSSCAGCGGRIADRYYLQAVDRQWHVSCLTCCRCKVQLDSELTCFARDGHIYCKEDYYRLFAVKRCARCQHGIFANELVMRARDLVFHLHCFTCNWCNAALTQGDYFGLRDDLVYCRAHYELLSREQPAFYRHPCQPEEGLLHHHPLLQQHPSLPSGGEEGPLAERPTAGDGGSFAAFAGGGAGSGRKGRPRKRKNGDLADAISRQGAGLSPVDPGSCHPQLYQQLDGGNSRHSSPPLSVNGGQGGGGGQRTKRMRTSFKHHQLRTMKSYFAINQNPDAKDLKQLAQKTGLSKRVLQVWFQNARAKWRRNNLKQQDSMSGGMIDQPPPSQLHQGGGGGSLGVGGGMCSPGATSSFSEPSPVHSSCGGGGGGASDGSLSTQAGPSMDFDSSDPMTPLVAAGHHGLGAGSVHNGEGVMHITSFHELF